MIVRSLVADPRFEQNRFCARLDQHAIHVHANAVFLVRRTNLRPQLTSSDAEPRPSSETKFGVLTHRHGVVAYLHCAYPTSATREPGDAATQRNHPVSVSPR